MAMTRKDVSSRTRLEHAWQLAAILTLTMATLTAHAETRADWSAFGGMAVPMSYMADGKQYIVIAAGGNRRTFTEEGDAIVAYRLKDK